MNSPTKSQTFNEKYRQGKAFVGAYINNELKAQLGTRAVNLNLSMTEMITQAITEYLAKK